MSPTAYRREAAIMRDDSGNRYSFTQAHYLWSGGEWIGGVPWRV
jgi:hypothetical protein